MGCSPLPLQSCPPLPLPISPCRSPEEIDFAGSPATVPTPHPQSVRCARGSAPPRIASGMNKGDVHHKETHGTSSDITEETPVDKVKGPNLLERAKEEVEALIGAVHDKMEHQSSPRRKEGESHNDSKEGGKVTTHKMNTHENETHGTSNDISEDTPVDKVKGPNVFERAKEEIEAIVEAIHPKNGSNKK